MIKRVLPLTVALALAGCAVGPDYQHPAQDMPAQWQQQAAADAAPAAVDARWWQQFGDAELDKLVDEALAHNQQLAQAAARVEEARALAGIARAELMPSARLQADSDRARAAQGFLNPEQGRISSTHKVNVGISWELDLWGKLRRSSEAARGELEAARASRDGMALSVAAQVAQSYFQLRAADAQLEIAERTLQSREDALKLREKRFKGGMTSELDYRQAEAETAQARTAVPRLKQAQGQLERSLGVLLGRSPRQLIEASPARGKPLDALVAAPAVPAALPSAQLSARPDIIAAEGSLKAANARIGVARAAYFPSITLTGLLGTQSRELSGLFSGPASTRSFAGQLLSPIFDSGTLAAGVDAAKARQQAALANYQLVIQNAFRETQDALAARSLSEQQEQAQLGGLKAVRTSVRLAKLRYENGYSGYLEVLDAERGEFQSELDVVAARLTRLEAAVNLYKALGGGWQAPAN